MANDYRKEFMLKMYSAFWECISRAEDSAWKIIAAYVALFVGLNFLLPIVGPAGVATIFVVFSFMAIALALRANVWFLRNLGLIANLEKEFLDKSDYEMLIPRFFQEHGKFLNWEIWILQAIAYFVICVSFLFYVFPMIELCQHKIIVLVIFIAGLSLVIVYGRFYYNELRRFSKHAPGKKHEP